MPAHRGNPTVGGHFAFLFDSSESIRLVVIAYPTVWLHNRLIPNQSTASLPPVVKTFKAMVEQMFNGGATAKGALIITPEKVIVTTPGADNKKEL